MGQEQRRTCASCGKSFVPYPRNARHQRYCAQPACWRACMLWSRRSWFHLEAVTAQRLSALHH